MVGWRRTLVAVGAVGAAALASAPAVAFAAEVPVVSGVTPDHGRIEGGTEVVITGTGFSGATSVHFGAFDAGLAESFTVVSDTEIIAVTQPHKVEVVHVTVTTPAGTSDSFAVAATFTFGTPFVCPSPPATPGFSDIAASYAAADIACLAEHGVVAGTAPGVYSPTAPLTRGQIAVILGTAYDAIAGGPYNGPATHPFADIAGHYAEARIAQIYNLGFAAGTSPTIFSPDTTVTRAQMAVFLQEFFYGPLYEYPPQPPYAPHPFADVPDDHYAAGAIRLIWNLGVTEGTTPTTFSPEDPVTREQIAVFMNELLG